MWKPLLQQSLNYNVALPSANEQIATLKRTLESLTKANTSKRAKNENLQVVDVNADVAVSKVTSRHILIKIKSRAKASIPAVAKDIPIAAEEDDGIARGRCKSRTNGEELTKFMMTEETAGSEGGGSDQDEYIDNDKATVDSEDEQVAPKGKGKQKEVQAESQEAVVEPQTKEEKKAAAAAEKKKKDEDDKEAEEDKSKGKATRAKATPSPKKGMSVVLDAEDSKSPLPAGIPLEVLQLHVQGYLDYSTMQIKLVKLTLAEGEVAVKERALKLQIDQFEWNKHRWQLEHGE
ncbi:hypothetical protein C8F01DRAFT_1264025 [Mycena amicta]|nr:hypothetical protein C8F01DRAFT_1264025 [Mycena amicta]